MVDTAMYEILEQHDVEQGWSFDAQAIDGDTGELRRFTLRLAWSDYNRWSPDGADRPSAVAEAVVAFALRQLDTGVFPVVIDSERLRREHREADKAIPGLIQR